uniref:Homeobox-leucine zipper protein MERISTEM L1 n=1 Tax=Rhizophora mucronata TaxID=61149 RepID=A0A2P2IQD8_RHIMU
MNAMTTRPLSPRMKNSAQKIVGIRKP